MSLEDNATDGITSGAEDAAIETDTTVTDTDESGEPSTDDTNPETGKLYTQKELDEQAAKIRKAEERKWQKRLDREVARAAPVEPLQTLEPPNESDYTTIAEYTRALARHEIAVQKQQDAIEKSAETSRKEVAKMISEAHELPGYDHDTVAPFLVEWGNDDAFADDLLESPVRAKLLEYLSLNPDELDKVDEMSKSGRRRWLGRMEARFEKKPTAAVDPKPRVNGGNVSNNLYKTNPGKMSDDDWFDERRKEGTQYRRR